MKILPLLLLGSAFVFGQTKAVVRCWQTTATFDEYNACLKKPAPKPAGKKKAVLEKSEVGFISLALPSALGDSYNFILPLKIPGDGLYVCKVQSKVLTIEHDLKFSDISSDPIDVPAIQEPVASFPVWTSTCDGGKSVCWGSSRSCSHHGHIAPNQGNILDPKCEGGYEFSCADKHNYTLQASVDGEVRICHRIKP